MSPFILPLYVNFNNIIEIFNKTNHGAAAVNLLKWWIQTDSEHHDSIPILSTQSILIDFFANGVTILILLFTPDSDWLVCYFGVQFDYIIKEIHQSESVVKSNSKGLLCCLQKSLLHKGMCLRVQAMKQAFH